MSGRQRGARPPGPGLDPPLDRRTDDLLEHIQRLQSAVKIGRFGEENRYSGNHYDTIRCMANEPIYWRYIEASLVD